MGNRFREVQPGFFIYVHFWSSNDLKKTKKASEDQKKIFALNIQFLFE